MQRKRGWLAIIAVGLGLFAAAAVGVRAWGLGHGAGAPAPADQGGMAVTPPADPALPPEAPAPPPPPAEPLVAHQGPVEHIFFHPLIVYPELAFGGSMAKGYDDWFVTIPEFRRILDSLYARNYILIDFDALFDRQTENGKATLVRKELMLPKDKKPLVISVDDLNYYDYMRANGNAYKLVVDTDGRVKTYSVTPQGAPVISAENEIIPILDAFVNEHPDFSFQGAKGVIALTGYEGILGYRTNNPNSATYEQEKADALKVVARLKATGWSFASHGWGHLDAAKIKYSTLERDTQRWLDEVAPLIGPTDIYIYPFGSSVPVSDPKFQYLQSVGFRIFASVGPDPYLKATADYALMDRRHIDGMALKTQRSHLLPLFDANEVIDPVRPRGK